LVCTHNGAERLPETIRYLSGQETHGIEWELLIVDNASTDDTARVARRECGEHAERLDYRLLYEPEPGKGNALLRGFDAARGRYLVVCDDDTWLAPDYLRRAVEVMDRHEQIGALRGRGRAVLEGEAPEWTRHYEGAYGEVEAGAECGDVTESVGALGGAGTVLSAAAVRAVREAGFLFVNPFHGEDYELCLALRTAGYRLWYDDSLSFEHYVVAEKLGWEEFLRRMAISGRNTPQWQAYNEVIDGTFCATEVPSRLYWLRKVVPSLVNGHLAKVLWGLLKHRVTGNTQCDRYRSLVYQLNVWLGYLKLRGRFVELIRTAIRIKDKTTNLH
jgi:glycosyltransferase involved in cell wall biosynthesis